MARRTKSFTTVKKSIQKLVELPSLVAKCCKHGKYSLAKFANLYVFVLRAEKVTICELKCWQKILSCLD